MVSHQQPTSRTAPIPAIPSQSGRAGSPSTAGQSSAASSSTQPAASSPAANLPKPAPGLANSKYASVNALNGSSSSMSSTVNSPHNAVHGMNNEHSKKPSVTISAAGASGYIPNGGPVSAGANRPHISFGQMNAGGPPASATIPLSQSSMSLSTPASNPRITSPATSPSPIPQPASSGGRPPSALPVQGNALSFGSLTGGDNDAMRGMRHPAGSMPVSQSIHLQRESSQSGSDMVNLNMNMGSGPSRGGFGPGGRGVRMGSFTPGHPSTMSYSPGSGYRPLVNQRGTHPSVPPYFQGQGVEAPNSPHAQHRNPIGSHPGTPQMQHMQMANSQHAQYNQGYGQYSGHVAQPSQYGMQPQYDPSYPYFQSPYNVHPAYFNQGLPPQSPRQFKHMQPNQHQQFGQSQFTQPTPQSMSRTSSQISERPASSMGSVQPQHVPQSAIPASSNATYNQPSQPISAPSAPSFVAPVRKSKAIVIKNDQGEIISFDKKVSTPSAAARTPSPAPPVAKEPSVSPLPSSTISHAVSEAKPSRTAAEIKAEFEEQVRKSQEDEKRVKEDEEKAAKAKTDAADAEAKEREDAEIKRRAAAEAQAAEAKAATEKAAAEATKAREAQEAEAKAKEAQQQAEAKAAEEKAVADAESAKAKKESDAKAEAQDQKDATADAEKDATAEKERLEQEEQERMIAEMEAYDREEEERERAYQAKKKQAAEEKAGREKATSDEEMKRLEREAEAMEEAREREKEQPGEAEETDEAKAEREAMFASLKKPTIGPGADEEQAESTITEQVSTEPSVGSSASTKTARTIPAASRPTGLKLDTPKPSEPSQPSPAMQSLKSARFVQLQDEKIVYPEGISSPTQAANSNGKRAGRVYPQDFLKQFQEVVKEKPSLDFEQKIRDAIGDQSDTGSAKSARTPAIGPRATSSRGGPPASYVPMGSFGGGGRTLPVGTSSADRFAAASSGRPIAANPLAGMVSRPGGGFQMGSMAVPRGGASMSHGARGGAGGRGGSSKTASRRDDRAPSRKEMEKMNSSMPLTAGSDLKPLEMSKSGWKPPSVSSAVSQPMVDAAGHMAPDMVQRKVKSNLNKMTPERFDKIAGQILTIAAQSKDESDGRTLRQVIALTFEKACDEAHWASMYAKFCKRMLEEMSPEIKDENVTDKAGSPVVGGPLFRKYLLNRCQEEFERGWEVNLPAPAEGSGEEAAMLSDDYYVAAAAKRKGLGLIQFIGELYKLGMLSIRIMHECVMKLLNFDGVPDDSAVESLVKLLRTVGGVMEYSPDPHGEGLVKKYFEKIESVLAQPGLPSRVHFMLLDTVDLRKAKWQSKDDAKGPKTIQEIREEAVAAQQAAEMERSRTAGRGGGGGGGGGGGRMHAGRGDARNFSGGGMMAPPDYPRNQVGTDDLRRLNMKRQPAQTGPGKGLGPTSMFRSSSGRTGLGPGGNLSHRGGDDSGLGSRTASQRDVKDEEPKSAVNAFRYVWFAVPSP